MVQVYIALGSNLNMPTEQLNSALEAISALPNTELKSVSGFYQSKPLGPQDQPDYVKCSGDDRNHSPTFSFTR